jgi:hypothetical protein
VKRRAGREAAGRGDGAGRDVESPPRSGIALVSRSPIDSRLGLVAVTDHRSDVLAASVDGELRRERIIYRVERRVDAVVPLSIAFMRRLPAEMKALARPDMVYPIPLEEEARAVAALLDDARAGRIEIVGMRSDAGAEGGLICLNPDALASYLIDPVTSRAEPAVAGPPAYFAMEVRRPGAAPNPPQYSRQSLKLWLYSRAGNLRAGRADAPIPTEEEDHEAARAHFHPHRVPRADLRSVRRKVWGDGASKPGPRRRP